MRLKPLHVCRLGTLALCPNAGDSQRGWVELQSPAPVGKSQGARQDRGDQHSAIPKSPELPLP